MEPAFLGGTRGSYNATYLPHHRHRESRATAGLVMARSFEDISKTRRRFVLFSRDMPAIAEAASIMGSDQLESRLTRFVAGLSGARFVGPPPRPKVESSSCRGDRRSTSW
jgi:hypothetical protein